MKRLLIVSMAAVALALVPMAAAADEGGGGQHFGPFAGADDGPPSLFGPCGGAMMMNRCVVPFEPPSLRRLATLRNHSVT